MPSASKARWLLVALSLGGIVNACQCDLKAIRGAPPHLQVEPNPIVLSAIVGRSSEAIVRVSNTSGRSVLKLTRAPEIVAPAGSAPVFSLGPVLDEDCAGQERKGDLLAIAPTECARLSVIYTPVAHGSDSAILRFVSSDPAVPTLDVPIEATATTVSARLCVTESGTERCNEPGQPLSVVWSEVDAVGASSSRAFSLVSAGTDAVAVTAADFSGDADFALDPAIEALAPRTLAAGAAAPFQVTMTRAQTGARHAALRFTTTAPDAEVLTAQLEAPAGPALCWCVGSATTPCASTNPADFGHARLGDSASLFLELTSCGDGQLVFVDRATADAPPVRITQGAGVFSLDQTAAPSPGQSVSAGEAALRIPLTFAPDATTAFSGKLEVHTNIEDVVIDLTGTGDPLGCVLTAEPTLDFGNVQVGGRRELAYRLTNTGSEACLFPQNPSITQGVVIRFFQGSYSLEALPAGATITGTAIYEPVDTVGPDVGTVSIYYRGASESVDVRSRRLPIGLTGTPAHPGACLLRVMPSIPFNGTDTVAFGGVVIGATTFTQVTIINIGSIECELRNPRIVQSDATGEQAFTPYIPWTSYTLPRALPPMTSYVNLSLAFRPTSTRTYGTGTSRYTLEVDTDDLVTYDGSSCQGAATPGCVGFNLTGTGVGGLQVDPGSLDYGDVSLGCASPQRSVTVTNTTQSTVQLTSIAVQPPSQSSVFHVQSPATPYPLAPGDHLSLPVTYTPMSTTADSAVLFIGSDLQPPLAISYATVSLTGSGTTVRHYSDDFLVPENNQTDILLVIDNSLSMIEEQSHLAGNAEYFVSIGDMVGSDYHIAVVTTDIEDPLQSGRFQGTPRFVTPGPTAGQELAERIAALGIDGSGNECGLSAMQEALSAPLIDDAQTNGGFLRPDSRLAVVVVSDEDDHSAPAVATFETLLRTLRPTGSAPFSFNAVTGPQPQGCTSLDGAAEAGTRYLDLVRRTNGRARSICESDWGTVAGELAGTIYGSVSSFPLQHAADPATIVVHVNGTVVPSTDYRYDAPTRFVIFNASSLPPSGAAVVIDYDAPCF